MFHAPEAKVTGEDIPAVANDLNDATKTLRALMLRVFGVWQSSASDEFVFREGFIGHNVDNDDGDLRSLGT